MTVQEKILEITARRMKRDISELHENINLKKDLNADSIDVVEIIFELEETYNIAIDDSYAEKINTIGDASKVIEQIISEAD